MTSVSVAPDGRVFAAGYSGTLMEWNGSEWILHDTPTGDIFWGVWAESSTRVFLAAQPGAVWTYEDGDWRRFDTGEYSMNDVHGAAGRVFAVGTTGTLLERVGYDWVERPTGWSASLTAVWVSQTGRAYVAMDLGSVGTWNGSSFSTTPVSGGQYLDDIWGTSDTDIYVSGNGPTVEHFEGLNWNALPIPPTGDIRGIWTGSAGELFAVAGTGEIAHWINGLWSVEGNGQAFMQGIRGGSNQVVTVGNAGRIIRRESNDWIREDRGTQSNISGLYAPSTMEAFACTEDGRVIRVTDGSVESVTLDANCELSDIHGNSATDMYAVGRCAPGARWVGVIYHFDGGSWSTAFQFGINFSAVWAAGDNNVYATELWGEVWHFDGEGWTADSLATSHRYTYDIWGSDDGALFFTGCHLGFGQRYGYLKYRINDTWFEGNFTDVDHFRGVWGRSWNDVYVVADQGHARHFDGSSWNSLPSIPNEPYGYGIGGNSTDVFFGGYGLWRLNGSTFERENVGTHVPITGVAVFSDGTAWIAGGNGAILRCVACDYGQ